MSIFILIFLETYTKMGSIGTDSLNRCIDVFKADATIPTLELFATFEEDELVKPRNIIKYYLNCVAVMPLYRITPIHPVAQAIAKFHNFPWHALCVKDVTIQADNI